MIRQMVILPCLWPPPQFWNQATGGISDSHRTPSPSLHTASRILLLFSSPSSNYGLTWTECSSRWNLREKEDVRILIIYPPLAHKYCMNHVVFLYQLCILK